MQAWVQLFTTDWLFRHNHDTSKDVELLGICITMNAIESCIDIPDCLTAKEIRIPTLGDKQIGMLPELLLCSWSLTKAEVQKIAAMLSFKDEIEIIEGIAMKDIRIIIPAVLQDKAQKQLWVNNMGKERTRMLVCEMIYLISMNPDIEVTFTNA